MMVISTHHLWKSARERDLVVEYEPSVLACFGTYLHYRRLSFRATSVSAVVVGRVVDDNADHVNLMAPIVVSEFAEGIIQQRKSYGSKVLRSDGTRI